MLTIMIILMLLKLLYDGIGAFYSQAIVSAKNPYAAYREALGRCCAQQGREWE